MPIAHQNDWKYSRATIGIGLLILRSNHDRDSSLYRALDSLYHTRKNTGINALHFLFTRLIFRI